MSVDLTNDSGETFDFSNAGWRHLIVFAEASGWHDESHEDDRASAEVAAALADAIERGMGPGSDAEVAERVGNVLTEQLVIPSGSDQFPSTPIVVAEKTIAYWREFMRFARRGGFRVDY